MGMGKEAKGFSCTLEGRERKGRRNLENAIITFTKSTPHDAYSVARDA
jgi:hypothetical protein